jgi:hypothetical protein
MRDDWQNENNTDFNWKETPLSEHPNKSKCTCPRHEHLKELAVDSINTRSALRIKLCPNHYRVYYETLPEMKTRMTLVQRFFTWFAQAIGWVKIVELKYAQTDLCLWCKYGSGGRGIKTAPTIDGEED